MSAILKPLAKAPSSSTKPPAQKLCYLCVPNGKLCSSAAPGSEWSDEDWNGERDSERARRKKEQQKEEAGNKKQEESDKKAIDYFWPSSYMTLVLKKTPYPFLIH